MKIVILGARADGHAKVVLETFYSMRKAGSADIEILGFLDDDAGLWQSSILDKTVLGGIDMLNEESAGITHFHAAVGDNQTRLKLIARARAAGSLPASAIHSHSFISPSAVIGSAVLVAAGAVVNSSAVLGEGVIVNTGATVDHDCRLEEGAHVCPGAHLSGRVSVGARAWIGTGASIIEDRRIGADSVVGAGAAVIEDVPPNVLVAGVPATKKKDLVKFS